MLLPNFLHHFDEATCITLLKKTHASLEARGRVIIAEFVPNEDRITPPIPASFSMMMLGLTQNGDAYTKRQLDSMLQQAGFGPSELLQVPNSPEQLVVSRK